MTVTGLNGTYSLTAPTLYGPSPGVRWISNAANVSTRVVANGTFSVTYTEQFEITVLGSAGGSVTPDGSQWVAPGTILTLSAVANSSSVFLSWNGTGNGNYTGNSSTGSVTVTGPVTEQVSFGPKPALAPAPSSGSGSSEPEAIGLLLVLLAAGLVVGVVVARRRPPPSDPGTDAPSEPQGPADEP